jgi:C-terminal processing protease CtpA/Prc
VNYGFEETQYLDHNIACLAILGFILSEDDDICDAIARIMTEITDTDALLIDLRGNGGGQPETVSLIASYLFDSEPVHLNDLFSLDDGGSTEEFWTRRYVKGRLFRD